MNIIIIKISKSIKKDIQIIKEKIKMKNLIDKEQIVLKDLKKIKEKEKIL